MIQEIFVNHNLSSDFSTEWIPLIIPKISGNRQRLSANTLVINWSGLTGALDGQFVILGSGDGENSAIGATVILDKASTENDVWVFKLAAYISYIKIIYKRNGISSGNASAVIEFQT